MWLSHQVSLLRSVWCSCNEEQQVVVEVQGQLRLGKSDLGVNARRNQQFLLALSKAARAGEIPAGQCMLSPGF